MHIRTSRTCIKFYFFCCVTCKLCIETDQINDDNRINVHPHWSNCPSVSRTDPNRTWPFIYAKHESACDWPQNVTVGTTITKSAFTRTNGDFLNTQLSPCYDTRSTSVGYGHIFFYAGTVIHVSHSIRCRSIRDEFCKLELVISPLASAMYLKFSLLAALTGVAVAIPSRRSPFVLHEERATEPFDWVGVGRLESEKILPMRFGLTQGNLSRVEDMLMAVSHPESPTYGKYYTPADIVEIFSPSNETISSVTRWLIDSGFAKSRLRLSANKGWLSVDATTSEVEKLLNAEYYVYNHTSGEKQFG